MSRPGDSRYRRSSRREFLRAGSSIAAGLALARSGGGAAASAPAGRVRVGVMGTSRNSVGGDGRGAGLARDLAGIAGVEVAYVCDADSRNVPKAVESVCTRQATPPKGVRDFRAILDDRSVDALVIATPDHWHAPAAILACAAGKHVYVEKPCSHNAQEGEWLVAAARRHKRLVQHGTQRRSWPGIAEAVQRLREGRIGRILYAKCWYFSPRPSIGRGKAAAEPEWLDWPLWQGPAPRREYRDNVVHYNWHWFWHWGTAELGNNGVHMIDVARWGLGVDYPIRAVSVGGKYRYPGDDQETPDTSTATFEFAGGTSITWEHRSWSPQTPLDPPCEVAFYGETGTLTIEGAGYAVHDLAGKQIAKGGGPGGDVSHLENFINAIRKGDPLNAEIEEGHKSALLCHLGNISYRTGRAVRFDPNRRQILDDRQAADLWRRDYQSGWEPKV